MSRTLETPTAIAELIDKITILEIKVERFTDPAKTKNARTELALLTERRDREISSTSALRTLAANLKAVNERIWELEDAIRDCERRSDFGPGFVRIAREIYKTNDRRAAVKRRINLEFDSAIVEEKSYNTI
jgi:Family of unknown function (DUF6165)